MRRRRTAGPLLDFVDVLLVGRQTRLGNVDELARMAVEHGFVSVAELQAEADRLHAEWQAAQA